MCLSQVRINTAVSVIAGARTEVLDYYYLIPILGITVRFADVSA